MADRMAEGTLAARLTAMRGTGDSWETIARVLYDEHGIEVTGQTLRTWGVELGLRDERASA